MGWGGRGPYRPLTPKRIWLLYGNLWFWFLWLPYATILQKLTFRHSLIQRSKALDLSFSTLYQGVSESEFLQNGAFGKMGGQFPPRVTFSPVA